MQYSTKRYKLTWLPTSAYPIDEYYELEMCWPHRDPPARSIKLALAYHHLVPKMSDSSWHLWEVKAVGSNILTVSRQGNLMAHVRVAVLKENENKSK